MTTGYDSAQADKKCLLPRQSGHMITFSLANRCVLTLRTSGTEPKIKWVVVLALRASTACKIRHRACLPMPCCPDALLPAACVGALNMLCRLCCVCPTHLGCGRRGAFFRYYAELIGDAASR